MPSQEGIDPEVRRKMLAWSSKARTFLTKQAGFWECQHQKGLFVCLLAIEGAIMFDDMPELAKVMADFCKAKSRETIISQ